MVTYEVIVQERPEPDLKYLGDNDYNLAVAKSVADSDGKSTFNTIYDSRFLAPNMDIRWTTTYGVNFSLDVPTKGAKVTYAGLWQECGAGDGYILDKNGVWKPNTGDKNNKKDYLNVLNHYTKDACIIIGTQDPNSLEWQPIYYSPSALAMNGYGAYKPLESVQLWFGSKQQTGYVIADQKSPPETYEMSEAAPEKYQHWFRFWADLGKWTNQKEPYTPAGTHGA